MKGSAAAWLLGAGTLTVVGIMARGRPLPARPIIAVALLGAVAIPAEAAAPDVVRPLTAALFLTAALTYGVDVARAAARL